MSFHDAFFDSCCAIACDGAAGGTQPNVPRQQFGSFVGPKEIQEVIAIELFWAGAREHAECSYIHPELKVLTYRIYWARSRWAKIRRTLGRARQPLLPPGPAPLARLPIAPAPQLLCSWKWSTDHAHASRGSHGVPRAPIVSACARCSAAAAAAFRSYLRRGPHRG